MTKFSETVKENIDNCLAVIDGGLKRGRFPVASSLVKEKLFEEGIYNPLRGKDLKSAFLELCSFENGVRRAKLYLTLRRRERARKTFLAYGLVLNGHDLALNSLVGSGLLFEKRKTERQPSRELEFLNTVIQQTEARFRPLMEMTHRIEAGIDRRLTLSVNGYILPHRRLILLEEEPEKRLELYSFPPRPVFNLCPPFTRTARHYRGIEVYSARQRVDGFFEDQMVQRLTLIEGQLPKLTIHETRVPYAEDLATFQKFLEEGKEFSPYL